MCEVHDHGVYAADTTPTYEMSTFHSYDYTACYPAGALGQNVHAPAGDSLERLDSLGTS